MEAFDHGWIWVASLYTSGKGGEGERTPSHGLSYNGLALTSNTHREALLSQVFGLCNLPTENTLAISLKIKKHHPPGSS